MAAVQKRGAPSDDGQGVGRSAVAGPIGIHGDVPPIVAATQSGRDTPSTTVV